MATIPQIGLRLTGTDLQFIELLKEKTGIATRTDVVRLALRRLAEQEGVWVPHASLLPKKKQK